MSACWAYRRQGWRNDGLALSVEGFRSKGTDNTDDQSRRCQLPQRLQTPTPNVFAVQRSKSPASTGAWTRTYRRIPVGRRPRPFAFHVCAGHSPATQGRNGRLIQPILDTPTGYIRRPPSGVSAGQGSSDHVVAGEGFEPSKLSRWIYSPLPLAARATCLGA